MRACFDADGRLRPDAASSRPKPADAAHIPPRIPATDDPEEIIAEAFVHACQHGRTEVVRWFLDHGVRPDVAPYLGRTGLHWAIPYCHLEVIRLLPERGADPSIRDEFLQADADGWRLWRKSRDDYASYASEEPLVTAGDGVVRGLCAPTPVLRGLCAPALITRLALRP